MRPNQNTSHWTKPFIVIALLSPLMIRAQTAPPAVSSPDDGEVVQLSPFQVTSSADVGYLAQNTLSGSRLNTPLVDTAAAISVLTPEFLHDIGATSMKDIILFENNAVPDVGDSANNFNGNPLIGNSEWQLRIRGLPASYARNYFPWIVSTDFYNVDRIDESRGPNSILFGFGSAGGIVNTTTKQAQLGGDHSEVTFLTGSWSRYRGTFDVNTVLVPNKLALRLNAVDESGKSWREFEFDRAKRADLALTYQPTKTSTVRAEAEIGKVTDNVARPWLMIDESFLWRNAGRPTYSGAWPSGTSSSVATFWPSHLVVADDGVARDWIGHAYGSNANGASAATGWNAPTWSQMAFTPQNLAIIPMNSNSGGPDATRDTKYKTFSAFYDNQITDQLSVELAVNHQSNDFLGYDPNGSRATTYFGDSSELWGDASADLPGGAVNPNAGKLYLENNWTRRQQTDRATQLRASMAYDFKTGDWAHYRVAGMYEHSWHDYNLTEDCEAFLNRPDTTAFAEADVNRVYLRHYFQPGDAADIHVLSWRTPVAGAGWVPDQYIDNSRQGQDTVMSGLQAYFLHDRLVGTAGLRFDSMDYTWDPSVRDATTTQWTLDPANEQSHSFNAHTLTLGAVFHATKAISLYANHSDSRDLPNVHLHVIGSEIPPMIVGQGNDAGLKFDFFGGKLYATVGYYTTKQQHYADWGDIQTSVTDLNTKVLAALQSAGLISAADVTARTIDANGFLEDHNSSGWECEVIANPTPNWRISANFSINKVINKNAMAEVKTWADANTAYWLQKAASQGGANFPLVPGTTWDYLGSEIGWLYNYHINNVVALDDTQARGERKYGANLYSRYTFSSGPLKGFAIGGGGRYQSANVLGFYNGAVRTGTDLVLADASLEYSFKTGFLGKKSYVDLQLNVSNVFNTRKTQIYTLAWWDPTSTVPERVGLQEPRKYTVSASIKF
jgi:outer membrane receptor protein involved in Fe transport